MEQELILEERKDRINAANKKYLKLGLMYCGKGIWITIKYIAIAWCAKQAFLGIKKFSIWSYIKTKQHMADKKAKKMEVGAKLVQATNEFYTETNTRSSTSLPLAPSRFSSMVDEAFEEFQRNMSSEEAQMHL